MLGDDGVNARVGKTAEHMFECDNHECEDGEYFVVRCDCSHDCDLFCCSSCKTTLILVRYRKPVRRANSHRQCCK